MWHMTPVFITTSSDLSLLKYPSPPSRLWASLALPITPPASNLESLLSPIHTVLKRPMSSSDPADLKEHAHASDPVDFKEHASTSDAADSKAPASSSDSALFKSHSRVSKRCHWCDIRQPTEKPFPTCSRCKEVIYCSKDCQKQSWPFHKLECSVSYQNQLLLAAPEYAEAAREMVIFRKWHTIRYNLLREAVVHALNLGKCPSNADSMLVFLKVKQKPNHASLPPGEKYRLTYGTHLTRAEALQVFETQSQALAHIHDRVNIHEFMKKKGGLGVSTVVLSCDGSTHMVDVSLPTAEDAKKLEELNPWGSDWVTRLQALLEIPPF